MIRKLTRSLMTIAWIAGWDFAPCARAQSLAEPDAYVMDSASAWLGLGIFSNPIQTPESAIDFLYPKVKFWNDCVSNGRTIPQDTGYKSGGLLDTVDGLCAEAKSAREKTCKNLYGQNAFLANWNCKMVE